jgi:GTP-binding protein Era
MTFLSGVITIVGPPNAGKSTLLNRLTGTKLAIVSPKPQTTRNRIMGVYHGDGFQMVFVDTPGIHKTYTALHRSMVASARATFKEVDIVMVVIEMPHPEEPSIGVILSNLRRAQKPSVLVINKIDKGPKEQLLPIIDTYRQRYPFEAIVPVSAVTGDGLERLLEHLRSTLKPGPALFPREMKTDQTESFWISEIIREKIYAFARQELPYSCAVTAEIMDECLEKKLVSVIARVHVESESQKGILIGARGKMVKAIGQASREELEKFFGTKVFLDLTVRVEKNWSRDPQALRRLGY